MPCGCVLPPSPSPSQLLLPLNPGERSKHVEIPRRAWQRLLGMLSGQDPLEWRVRNRWLFPRSAFTGSGPGPGLLCARSCSCHCLLAGPSDPRCRLACPVSAVNLAARPEEERGGAGPAGRRPGGQEGPAPGWSGCGESRGGWGEGAGAESRGGVTGGGSGRPTGRGGGRGGGSAEPAPAGERRRLRGPGQGFPGFGEAAAGPIFRRSPEFVVIVAAAATAPAAISSSWAAATSSSSSSSWAGPIPSPLPPPPGLGPRCLVPSRSRSCRRRRRLLIHPRAP